MSTIETRFSRAAATAALLGMEDSHRFTDKKVLLTGDAEALATANGAEMARSALQLLMRSCLNVCVSVPPLLAGLVGDLKADGARFAWDVQPTFVATDGQYGGYDAILSIGGSARPDLDWTAISSSGWLIRVSSGETPISGDCSQANPIGSLAAASVGVCEVFKRLIRLRPDLGGLLDGVTFSLWDYVYGSTDPGPRLPAELPVNLMINGAGAIGSGLVHLLARLPVTGRATLVDNQDYGEENWGTCLDMERGEVDFAKALVSAARLPPGLVVKPFKATVDEVRKHELGRSVPWPTIVLNGLDKIDPRHHAQLVWPDLAIDGAIDSDLQVRVSAHPWNRDVACLICTYQEPPGESSEVIAARATGLSIAAVMDQDRPLTEADVMAATPEKRDALLAKLGKTICSIVREEIAKTMSEDVVPDGFSPSVPFAACFSACMEVAELVRYLTTGTVGVRPLYQMSLLRGPEAGDRLNDPRHVDCQCQRYRDAITRFRAARQIRTKAA